MNDLTQEQKAILETTWKELFTRINTEQSNEKWGDDPIEAIQYEVFDLAAFDDMDRTLLRFLRARKFNVQETLKMFFDALLWRRRTNVAEIMNSGEKKLKQELVNAQMYFIWGVDTTSRPIIFFNTGNFIPTKTERDMDEYKRYLIYQMETARYFVGSKGVMVLADLSSFGRKNIDMEFSKLFADLFQSYYPETLGRAVVVGSGLKMALFEGVWSVGKYFLDVEVRKKVSFAKSKDVKNYMDAKYVPKSLGGEFDETEIRASAKSEDSGSPVDPELRKRQVKLVQEFSQMSFSDPQRDAKKAELRASWLEMASHRPMNLYQRLGLLKDGQVDWRVAKQTTTSASPVS